jgi:hypothetical protein
MSFDADGRQLFAFNAGDSLLHLFDIDAATGRLTQAPHSPLRPDDRKTRAARLHPNGLWLFALAEGEFGSRMHVFFRTPGGSLPVMGSPFLLRSGAQSFTFSPDGRYVCVVHKKTRLIAATGGLTQVPGSTTHASHHPSLTVSVVPPVPVVVASLPSPRSPSLQPMDTATPADPDEGSPRGKARE